MRTPLPMAAIAGALLAPPTALAKTVTVAGHAASQILDSSFSTRPLTMIALMGSLSLLPFAVMMLTSFAKISVVLSIARSALGQQQLPPTTVLTGLAVVLTAHVMAPVAQDIYRATLQMDLDQAGQEQILRAASGAAEPLRAFLMKHGRAEDREMFVELGRELRGPERAGEVREQDLSIVVPAFVISELKQAFQIGFLIFLPFLVLDMVIANILLALGMQTLSPTQVSLPFKLLLFVMVDGWGLLAKGLVLGYR
jgi:type III secretion protein R